MCCFAGKMRSLNWSVTGAGGKRVTGAMWRGTLTESRKQHDDEIIWSASIDNEGTRVEPLIIAYASPSSFACRLYLA